ncbi:MAG TPA: LysR substrate-binding domain-containing protein [Bradyrhizobium sp.]|nr:LysR substrate-binding domain-containing protein [Bradyrhizobium sp.]
MKLSTIDLQLFAAIADKGGITAAARHLGLTKSLVSRELAALEERLGTRLVHRTTRKTSLTGAGELLATHARRIVEETENAQAAIEAMREAPRGNLKVSAPFSILRFVLLPRIAEFRSRYPDIRLSFDASSRVLDLVDEGVDVAIRIGELPPSSLVARRLTTTPVVLVAAKSYLARRGIPAVPGDLVGHDILNLRPEAEPELWSLTRDDRNTQTVNVAPAVAVHDPGLLLDLVRQGLGVAPAPLLYARQAIDRGEIVRILPDYVRSVVPIHAVYPSRRMLAPKVRAFVEFAAEVVTLAAVGG